MAGRERLVAVFDAMDPVTASDWVQPFDRIGLNGGFRPTGDFHSPEIGDPKLPFEVADRRAAQSAYAVHRRHLPVWETSWAAHDRAVDGSCDMIAMFHGAMGGEDDAS